MRCHTKHTKRKILHKYARKKIYPHSHASKHMAYLSRFLSADVCVHSGCDIERCTCEMPGIRCECDVGCCCCCDCCGGCCCDGVRFGSMHNSNENSLSDGCIAIKCLSWTWSSFDCCCWCCCDDDECCSTGVLSNNSNDLPRLMLVGFCKISKIFRMSFLMLVSMVSSRVVSSVICVVSELRVKYNIILPTFCSELFEMIEFGFDR